ncbi:MAG: winged helix-turn-helix domain-containing protein [Pseudomonadota bacterium]
MRYRFEDFNFDSETGELKQNGELIEITPQVQQILHLLLSNQPRIITKEKLIDIVWKGRRVTDDAINVRISILRQAIGDTGQKQRLIKTVRGVGFRFIGDAITQDDSGLQRVASVASQSQNLQNTELTERLSQPSIAVFPFRLVGDANDKSIFAEALSDDILTALSRMRSLRVIARGSSFRFPSYSTSTREAGTAVGADYCVSGELEFFGSRMSLSVESAATDSESVIWRERVTLAPDEVHELRADLVKRIALDLSRGLEQNELERARLSNPNAISSWQALHLGLKKLNHAPLPDFATAEQFFRQAADDDRSYARAQAAISQSLFFRISWGERGDAQNLWHECERIAKKAFELDPFDPFCNLAMGRSLLHRSNQLGHSQTFIKKAVDLAPNYTVALADLARISAMTGDPEGGRSLLGLVENLDPHAPHPESINLTYILIDLASGNMEDAANRAVQMSQSPYLSLNSCGAMLIAMHFGGKREEGKKFAEALKQRFTSSRLSEHFATTHFNDPKIKAITLGTAEAYGLI